MNLYFDIGASNTRIGISEDGQSLGQTRIFPTEKSFDRHLEVLAAAVAELTQGAPLAAAAGGVAGPLNRERTGIMSSYLQDWPNRPIKPELERVLNCPVMLENDAALAALGEARLGAGKNAGIVAYFTFSTGLGGARIVNGKIDANSWGFEPRWQTANTDHGEPIFLDTLISGNALAKRFDTPPENILDQAAWAEVERLMAICLLNGIGFWSPDVIVIGGSIGESHYISLDNLKQRVAQAMDYPVDIPFVKASLGQLNGLHGAMLYLKDLQQEKQSNY